MPVIPLQPSAWAPATGGADLSRLLFLEMFQSATLENEEEEVEVEDVPGLTEELEPPRSPLVLVDVGPRRSVTEKLWVEPAK